MQATFIKEEKVGIFVVGLMTKGKEKKPLAFSMRVDLVKVKPRFCMEFTVYSMRVAWNIKFDIRKNPRPPGMHCAKPESVFHQHQHDPFRVGPFRLDPFRVDRAFSVVK
ncbi:putative Glucan endo-1,3-beta-glucosidase precursor [Corchorus olitorius]|uniref:Glucan endo-1,3-beta-glucosidase n=1 Tax=Corchorus olitorius TaxID=93759 RepID=A0A1R3H461_9ROSI|nr:putative Glucan endo-1,3-beta-glucosidase precursor [Corchorus olitorius]